MSPLSNAAWNVFNLPTTVCDNVWPTTEPGVQGFYGESHATDSRPQLRANTGSQ